MKTKKNGWTSERRKKQSEEIRTWKPWKYSTGATSLEGKVIISGNALKHGYYSADVLALRKALKAHSKMLRDFCE